MNFLPKLDTFEGPLDLLLHLIEQNEMDIYDIPIAEITDQYMEYLEGSGDMDTDSLSEFLVMAATLLEIKSKMLLPSDEKEGEDEEDPRQALVEQLLEYKLYKYMSAALKENEAKASRVMYKSETLPGEVSAYSAPVDLDLIFEDVTLEKLSLIFRDVMKRHELSFNEEAKRFGRIKKEEISLPKRMDEIREYMKKSPKSSFSFLIEERPTRDNMITTFLSILELMKTGEIKARQKKDDIELIWTGQN